MSVPATRTEQGLWGELASVLANHFESDHDCIDTINRLLRKNPWLNDSGSTLQIPRTGLRLSVEYRDLERLWPLIHASQVTTSEPHPASGAVVVLRWSEREYLMDGRRRINQWKRNGLLGPHRSLLLENEHNI